MNRTQQLKLLNDEIRRLFSENISENDAYDQLRSDPRFDSVRRSTVQSLYSKLQKDANKQARTKELNNQKRYHQDANKLLIYEGQSIKDDDTAFNGVWKDRYFLISTLTDDYLSAFKVFDIYHGISKELSLLSDKPFQSIRTLDGQFALMIREFNEVTYVHLAYVDLVEGTIELVQEAEKSDLRNVGTILFDKLDRSKFAIGLVSEQGVYSIIEYRLSGGKLISGDESILENFDFTLDIGSYANDQLSGLKFDDHVFGDMGNATVTVRDLHGEKKSKVVKLKPLPSNISIQWPSGCYRWHSDRMFLTIQFNLTKRYGVAFTDPHTQEWSVLEFAVDLTIVELSFVDNQSLLVSVGEHGEEFNNDEISKVYKLPISKPESLSRKAWFKVVTSFKKKQVDEPYKHARRFLPFNSDIQSLLSAGDQDNKGQ